jgi:rhodanese-related sulfurtransferase
MELAVQALAEHLRRADPIVLIDVREPFERDLCAIEMPQGTLDLHIPMRSIPARLPEIRSSAEQGEIVVYCHHGVRSRAVVDWLKAQGIASVRNLTGGIDAWSREVDPSVPRY